jgi:serine/threonine-protein kinase
MFWGIIILGILNFVIMPMYTRQGEELQLPDVTLMTVDSAVMVLQEANLTPIVDDSTFDDEVEKGRVIVQKPLPFSKVKKYRNVYLTISRGPRVSILPDFTGLTIRETRLRLQNLGLKEGWIHYQVTKEYPEGVVFKQVPKAGTRFTPGEKVNFYVSLGQSKENVRLPDLVGMSLIAAKNKLKELKIRNIRIIYEKREDLLPGTVIKQNPRKGTPLIEVKQVELTISQ